ncbi:MAG: hypothetical protein FRX48_05104 [Lasallia pustulata]|uniref:Uncharacterized protein n=1 Tax=Lasallia pustulata TaxID=136370 RepID=A0A5M8PPE0_9LECA|nr:MAG: hypothetical protein FRX48_05104 [Lasallia pustulata]
MVVRACHHSIGAQPTRSRTIVKCEEDLSYTFVPLSATPRGTAKVGSAEWRVERGRGSEGLCQLRTISPSNRKPSSHHVGLSLPSAGHDDVIIDPPMGVGSASKGTPLAVAPMTGGTVKSESGFSSAIDADFHMRLNAHQVIKGKSGSMIYLNYTGVVDITPELGAILGGIPDAKSTGNSFIEMRFETGDEKFKELETSTFVGAERFIVEKDKPVVVEYKLSKVLAGK